MSSRRNSTRARSQRSRRGRRKNPGLLRTLLLGSAIVLVPTVTLGVGGFLAYDHLTTEQIDTAYCYERRDRAEVAAFIDFSLTHQISRSQQRDLVNKLKQTYRGLPANGRISIFTTADDTTASVSEPVFTLCHPAESTAEQEDIGAPAKSTTKLARETRDADATFITFVESLITKSTDAGSLAVSSPILEQLQGISRYYSRRGLTRLVVYSDGVNNSPNGQFCTKKNELPKFDVFAKRPEYRFIAPDSFGGANIDFLMVELATLPSPQLPHCSNAELRAFWVDYFEANGSGQVRLTPLGYGAGK